jgi:hypothetical protein
MPLYIRQLSKEVDRQLNNIIQVIYSVSFPSSFTDVLVDTPSFSHTTDKRNRAKGFMNSAQRNTENGMI